MVNLGGRPPKFNSPEELEGLIEGFFESCYADTEEGRKQIRPITLEGLAYHIGCDRKTIWNYKHKPDFYPVIKRAIDRCQVALAEYAMTAKNPVGAIWLGINNYDYVNKSEVSVTQTTEQLSGDEVKRMLIERAKKD